jgi:hypothetical protein
LIERWEHSLIKCCFRLLGAKNPKKAFLGFIGLIPWGPTYMKRIHSQFQVPPVKGKKKV